MPKRRRTSFPAELPALRTRRNPNIPTLTTRSALGLITLFALPLYLIYLGTGDTVDMMELFNLVPVREAVRDQHWLMPTLNGLPRLEKPPLTVWIPALFATATQSESLWILRLPSVLLSLLTAFSTYWIALVVTPKKDDGRKLGILAACITLSMFVFLRHGRLATYDIYSTAFLTLGAVGLFGITDSPTKQNLYTLLAGVGIGLSILAKGPVPVATVCLPFGLYMMIFHRRPAPFLRLAIAALISIAVFLPWLLAIAHDYAQYHPWDVWYREILQNSTAISNNPGQTAKDLREPLFYYLLFFIYVAPHTPAFIAGLALPFLNRKAPADQRPAPSELRARWAWWLIVIGGLIVISCLAEKKDRYALPLFPFAGLLCASVWLEFARLPKEKKIDPPARLLLAAQALFFIVPPIAAIVAMIWSNVGTLPKWAGGDSFAYTLHALPPAFTYLLIVLTLGLAIYYARLLWTREFTLSLVFLVVTSWIFMFTVQCIYRADPSTHTNPARYASDAASKFVGPDYLLYTSHDFRPWLSTLYYLNRQVPELEPKTLINVANHDSENPISLILVTGQMTDNGLVANPDAEKFLNTFEAATHREPDAISTWFDERRHTKLYRFAPATPATTTAPATSPIH